MAHLHERQAISFKVLQTSILTPVERSVLGVINTETQYFLMKLDDIGLMINRSGKTVQRAVKTLFEKGLIDRKHTTGKKLKLSLKPLEEQWQNALKYMENSGQDISVLSDRTSVSEPINTRNKQKNINYKKIENIKKVIEEHPYAKLFKKILLASSLLILDGKYSSAETFKESLDRVQQLVESKDKYKDKAASIEHLLLHKDREQKYYINQPKNEQKGIEYPKWQPEEHREASTGLFDTTGLMASFRQKSFNREVYA